MDARNHLIIGSMTAAILLAVLYYLGYIALNLTNLITVFLIAMLFSLLPDIDHKSGTITWLFIGISALLIILGIINLPIYFMISSKTLILYGIILLAATYLLAQFAGHRGPVHTIWFGALVSGVVYFVTGQWQHCVIAFAAFYSHLAADNLWFKLN